MLTKKQLATTAPTAALVVSFVVVLLLGQWIGSVVQPADGAGSAQTSASEQPAGESGGAGDVNGSSDTAVRQRVVLDTGHGEPTHVTDLPAGTVISDDDLQAEPHTRWGGELETCIKLPRRSRVQGTPTSVYCTSEPGEFHVVSR
jgi:hypothetical protein